MWLCIIVRGERSSEDQGNLDRRWIRRAMRWILQTIMVISQLPDVSWWLSCFNNYQCKIVGIVETTHRPHCHPLCVLRSSNSRSKIYNSPAFLFFLSDEFGIPHVMGFTTWFAMCPLKVEESNSAPAIAGATNHGSGAALNVGSRFLTIPGIPGKPLFCARFYYSLHIH